MSLSKTEIQKIKNLIRSLDKEISRDLEIYKVKYYTDKNWMSNFIAKKKRISSLQRALSKL